MSINSQLSTPESKKQTKEINRTETESQIWRSFGGLSIGGDRERMREGSRIKEYKLVGTEQPEGC